MAAQRDCMVSWKAAEANLGLGKKNASWCSTPG